MNDPSQQAWFYTRGGEKLGPVDHAALQSLAREGGLNPRQDMIWSKGMDKWKLAGEVEGLFEKRVVDEAPISLPPPPALADPYSPPSHGSHEAATLGQAAWPGARRRSYLFMVVILPIVWAFAGAAAGQAMQGDAGGNVSSPLATGIMLLLGLLGVIYGLMRLSNLGMSRWWFLGNFVPFLNFWIGYRCFACPAGYAVHKKMDGVGIFLAIVYWLLIALVFIFIAVLIAVMLGGMGDPEMKRQIMDAIREANQAPVPAAP